MKKYIQILICLKIILCFSLDCFSQNSMVGDGFGGRLWYKPYNLRVGSYTAYSICPDSSQLFAWGYNGWGQFGNGDYNSSTLPIKINELRDIKYCTSGYAAAIIKKDRTGWVFGHSFQNTPIKVLEEVKFVNAGTNYCTFIKEDGTVWSLGDDFGIGTFGTGGSKKYNTQVPQKMYGINTAVRVAVGGSTTIILLSDGTVMTTGLHWRGSNVNDTFLIPRKVNEVKDIIDVKANANSNLLLDKNGDVYQLIIGDSFYTKLDSLKKIVAISGCNDGSSFMALDQDHNCFGWGNNSGGALGNGASNNSQIPSLIQKNVNDIHMAELFSYIIKSDGTLWASGISLYGASIWLNLEDIQRFKFTQVNTYCPLIRMPIYLNNEMRICEDGTINFNGKSYATKGTYFDTIKSNKGDTFFQINVQVIRKTKSTQNLLLCYNDSLKIGKHIYKNNGNYIDTVVNSEGCDSIITTVLKVLQPSQKTMYYKIKNGDTLKFLNHFYTQPGIYFDTLKNSFGCDSIVKSIVEQDSVAHTDNKFHVYISNAFSPNQDNLNQQFNVVGEGIKDMKMEIFNRWGEKLFESRDSNPMWDGTYKNETCKQDVFIYLITIIDTENKVHHYAGTITLL